MRTPTAPHANPLRAALECAKMHGIHRDKVARALLACAGLEDWRLDDAGAQDDVLAVLAERTNIVVYANPHGAFVAELDQ